MRWQRLEAKVLAHLAEPCGSNLDPLGDAFHVSHTAGAVLLPRPPAAQLTANMLCMAF